MNVNFSEKYLALSVIFILLTACCNGGGILITKEVNTRWEFSDGLKDNDMLYFITGYVIYQRGKELIPMYMKVPDKIHFDNVFLYYYDINKKLIRRVGALKPATSTEKVKYAMLIKQGQKLFIEYNTGWDKINEKMIDDIYIYDIAADKITEVTAGDKNDIHQEIFASYKSPYIKNPGIISSSQIRAITCAVPFAGWQIPSPLDYSKYNNDNYADIMIEKKGDNYYRDAIFERLATELSGEKLSDITKKMDGKFNKLSGYDRMVYHPYYEEWSTKIKMIIKFEKKDAKPSQPELLTAAYHNNANIINDIVKQKTGVNIKDDDGSTALMAAAYRNREDLIKILITNGADINAKDNNGCTPLMYAVFGKAGDALKILFEKGADPQICSNANCNAWMFASPGPLRERYLEYKEAAGK